MEELYHHGILGQKWGVRRYQNEDGSLTAAGRKRANKIRDRIEKKDSKWAAKNYNKIYKKTYKKSEKELRYYVKTDLSKRMSARNESGSLNMSFVNDYNRKMASLMNKNVGDLASPSGRTIKFIAKRGEVGVHMALADANYDMRQIKNGIYGNGRVAYKKKIVERV